MGADRVANRTVHETGSLLEHRQADAAVYVGGEVHGAPVVSEAESDRSLLIQPNDIEGIGGNPLQFMGVDHDAPDGLVPRTIRAQATRGQSADVDQIGVVYVDLIDIGVVHLHSQTAPEPGQEVKESLIGKLSTLDLTAVLYIDRT